jgi:hypothetical protein
MFRKRRFLKFRLSAAERAFYFNAMKIFDLYGLEVPSMDDARALFEEVAHQPLNAHESSHHCGEYWRLDLPNGGSLILQRNFDDFENEWTEESFKAYPFLLYVSDYPQADKLRSALNNLAKLATHLRRREIP